MNSVWSKFNGKSYKTSTGETIEGITGRIYHGFPEKEPQDH